MENKTSFHKFMDATNPVKIELGLIQDITNEIKSFPSSSQIVAPVEEAAKIAESKLNALEQKLQSLSKRVVDGKSMLKELGLDTKPLDDWDSYLANQKKLILEHRKGVQAAKFIMK